MEKCSICGSTRGVFAHDYLVVKKLEYSTYVDASTKQTMTTESLTGAEHHGICEECVRKSNIEQAKSSSFGVGFVTILAVLFLSANTSIPFLVGALITAAAVTAMVLLTFFLYTRRFAIRWTECGTLKTYLESQKSSHKYVEVGDGLYRDEKDFLSKNGFTTDIGRKLYLMVVATGQWRALLSAPPDAGTPKAEPRETVPPEAEAAPQNETDALLQRSVQDCCASTAKRRRGL